MFNGLQFKQMEILQIMVMPSKSMLVYATYPEYFVVFKFFVSPKGKVWAKTKHSWLQVGEQRAQSLRNLVETCYDKVPVTQAKDMSFPFAPSAEDFPKEAQSNIPTVEFKESQLS